MADKIVIPHRLEKTNFIPILGNQGTYLQDRNFYVYDDTHAWIRVHFCVVGGTIPDTGGVRFMELPSWAHNFSVQYCPSFAGPNPVLVINDGQYLTAWSSSHSAINLDNANILNGCIQMDLNP